MRVMFINNDGGGFADFIDIANGLSVGKFFELKIGGNPENYLIRVNRAETTPDYILVENDRVTITPTKIDGGVR